MDDAAAAAITASRMQSQVLAAVAKLDGVEYTTAELPFGSQRYLDTGVIITPDEIEDLRANYDCVLMGAIGDPRCPPGVIEKGILLKLRFELDQYINLRPVRRFPRPAPHHSSF